MPVGRKCDNPPMRFNQCCACSRANQIERKGRRAIDPASCYTCYSCKTTATKRAGASSAGVQTLAFYWVFSHQRRCSCFALDIKQRELRACIVSCHHKCTQNLLLLLCTVLLKIYTHLLVYTYRFHKMHTDVLTAVDFTVCSRALYIRALYNAHTGIQVRAADAHGRTYSKKGGQMVLSKGNQWPPRAASLQCMQRKVVDIQGLRCVALVLLCCYEVRRKYAGARISQKTTHDIKRYLSGALHNFLAFLLWEPTGAHLVSEERRYMEEFQRR